MQITKPALNHKSQMKTIIIPIQFRKSMKQVKSLNMTRRLTWPIEIFRNLRGAIY